MHPPVTGIGKTGSSPTQLSKRTSATCDELDDERNKSPVRVDGVHRVITKVVAVPL
jgi:hypothetical protein